MWHATCSVIIKVVKTLKCALIASGQVVDVYCESSKFFQFVFNVSVHVNNKNERSQYLGAYSGLILYIVKRI